MLPDLGAPYRVKHNILTPELKQLLNCLKFSNYFIIEAHE
jgi:hypothetical protein